MCRVSSREDTIAEQYVSYTASRSTPKAVSIAEVAKATERDNAIQCVFRLLAKKRNSVVEELTPEEADRVKAFKLVLDQLSRADDEDGSLLLKGTKLVIPHELTDRVIEIAHLTHPGIVKTKSLIREKVWFPGVDRRVEDRISQCMPCQACSNNTSRTAQNVTTSLRTVDRAERRFRRVTQQ